MPSSQTPERDQHGNLNSVNSGTPFPSNKLEFSSLPNIDITDSLTLHPRRRRYLSPNQLPGPKATTLRDTHIIIPPVRGRTSTRRRRRRRRLVPSRRGLLLLLRGLLIVLVVGDIIGVSAPGRVRVSAGLAGVVLRVLRRVVGGAGCTGRARCSCCGWSRG